jgi:hypothetical protein
MDKPNQVIEFTQTKEKEPGLLTDSSSNFIQHCRAYFETQCRKKTAFV